MARFRREDDDSIHGDRDDYRRPASNAPIVVALVLSGMFVLALLVGAAGMLWLLPARVESGPPEVIEAAPPKGAVDPAAKVWEVPPDQPGVQKPPK